jgi:soluble lytic murein transglycosylase-like protein
MFSSPPFADARAARTPPRGCPRRIFPPALAAVFASLALALALSRIQVGEAATPPRSGEGGAFLQQAGIAPLFTPEVQAWEEQILAWSEKYHLDPNLVATVMQIESCGYARAESPSGARGLFQVMPYHFQEGEDPFLPGTNAKRGLIYLRQAQESGGGIRLTLAGYNGGISAAQQPRENWPEETNRYVYWGLQIYKDARAGLEHSTRLQEWLDSGGSRLCRLARQQ